MNTFIPVVHNNLVRSAEVRFRRSSRYEVKMGVCLHYVYSGRAPVNGPVYIGPMGRSVSLNDQHSPSKPLSYRR